MTDYHTYMSDAKGSLKYSTEVMHINSTVVTHALHLFTQGGGKNNLDVYPQGRDMLLSLMLNIYDPGESLPANINYLNWRMLLIDRLPPLYSLISTPYSQTAPGAMNDALDAVQLWSLPEYQGYMSSDHHVSQNARLDGNRTFEYDVEASGEINYRVKRTNLGWSSWDELPIDSLPVSTASSGVRSYHGSFTTWWAWTDPDTKGIAVTFAYTAGGLEEWIPSTFEQTLLEGPQYYHEADPAIVFFNGSPWVVYAQDGGIRAAHPTSDDWQNGGWKVSEDLAPDDTVETTPAVAIIDDYFEFYVFYKAETATLGEGKIKFFTYGTGFQLPPNSIGTPILGQMNSWFDECTVDPDNPDVPLFTEMTNTQENANFNESLSAPAVVWTGGDEIMLAWVGPPEQASADSNYKKSYIYTSWSTEWMYGWGEHVRTPIQVSEDSKIGLGFVDGRVHFGIHVIPTIPDPPPSGPTFYLSGLVHFYQHLETPLAFPIDPWDYPIDPGTIS
jgi:hypothetical protein